jgi:hypothetical protein
MRQAPGRTSSPPLGIGGTSDPGGGCRQCGPQDVFAHAGMTITNLHDRGGTPPRRVNVPFRRPKPEKIPEHSSSAADLLDWLIAHGHWATLAEFAEVLEVPKDEVRPAEGRSEQGKGKRPDGRRRRVDWRTASYSGMVFCGYVRSFCDGRQPGVLPVGTAIAVSVLARGQCHRQALSVHSILRGSVLAVAPGPRPELQP